MVEQIKNQRNKKVCFTKYLLRCICFLCVGIAIFFAVQYVLTPKWPYPEHPEIECFDEFYSLDDNSVQVLFLGASHVYCGISPVQIYRETGIIAYDLSTAAQSVAMSYYCLEEALKTQKPEIVVLDVSQLFDRSYDRESMWMRIFVNIPLSKNKIEMARYFSHEDQSGLIQEEFNNTRFWQALVPFYQFHSRWDELKKEDFDFQFYQNTIQYTKGLLPSSIVSGSVDTVKSMNTIAARLQKETCQNTVEYELGERRATSTEAEVLYDPAINKAAFFMLEQIIQRCEEAKIPLLLTEVPTVGNPVVYEGAWTYQRHEIVKKYAQEKDIPFLDLVYDVDLGIDWTKDTIDGGMHLNLLGAQKVTSYLAGYLRDTYQLPSTVNKAYEDSLIIYDQVEFLIMLQTETDFFGWMERIRDSPRDLTVLMAVCEDMSVGTTKEIAAILHGIGLQTDFEGMRFSDTFLGVWEHSKTGENRIPYEAVSNREISKTYIMEDGTETVLTSRGGNEYPRVDILIDDVQYAKFIRGLNLVVYDKEAGIVVDCLNFDLGKQDNTTVTHFYKDKNLRNYERYWMKTTE